MHILTLERHEVDTIYVGRRARRLNLSIFKPITSVLEMAWTLIVRCAVKIESIIIENWSIFVKLLFFIFST